MSFMKKHEEIAWNSFDTLGNSRPVSPVVSNIKSFIQIAIAVGVFSVTTSSYAQTSLPTNKKWQETDIHHDSLDHNVDSLLMKYGEEKWQKTEIQNDSLDYHQKIITMNVDSLLMEYGEEKWMEIIREHMLIEVNKLRIEHGKQPLVQDDTLNTIAQNHSQYMYENNRYSHTDKEWHNANRRIEHAGKKFWRDRIVKWWENIAKNYRTIQSVLYVWMNSPWHRANILFVDWEALWIWYDVGFWTQNFY